MEQTLQARLIGATVLVALAVLLIPELLSGRKTVEPAVEEGAAAKGTRSFTIELGSPGGSTSVPGPSAPSATAQASRAPAPAGEPGTLDETPQSGAALDPPDVAAAAGPAPSPPAEQAADSDAAPASAAPAASSPPAESAKPAEAGGWVVQVGAFGSGDAARRLVDELSAAGFEAHVSPVTRSGRTLHRVRVGPVAERPAADQLAQRLGARGLPAAVVEND